MNDKRRPAATSSLLDDGKSNDTLFALWQNLERLGKNLKVCEHSSYYAAVCQCISEEDARQRARQDPNASRLVFREFLVTQFGWNGVQFAAALSAPRMKSIIRQLDMQVNAEVYRLSEA